MKRTISVIVAMVMLVTMAVPALAAEAQSNDNISSESVTDTATTRTLSVQDADLVSTVDVLQPGEAKTYTFDLTNWFSNDFVITLTYQTGKNMTSELSYIFESECGSFKVTNTMQTKVWNCDGWPYGDYGFTLTNSGNNFVSYILIIERV